MANTEFVDVVKEKLSKALDETLSELANAEDAVFDIAETAKDKYKDLEKSWKSLSDKERNELLTRLAAGATLAISAALATPLLKKAAPRAKKAVKRVARKVSSATAEILPGDDSSAKNDKKKDKKKDEKKDKKKAKKEDKKKDKKKKKK